MIPTFRPSLGPEELRGVSEVFDSRWLGMGEVTERFEKRLAEFLDCKHVVAAGHGTAALHLALDVLELEPNDEVIVPSLTFVATVQAIRMAGAVPVFCEVERDTLNLDVADALGRITPRTRAIMPVHYAGLPCEMDELLAETRRRNIRVVEDAAHAFGSTYRGRKIGTIGDLTCFSFDSIKNITCGEGGAIATDNDEFARTMRHRRKLGIETQPELISPEQKRWQYQVVTHGFRYHLSDINAAIGLAQLEKFPAFQKRRREVARRYDEAFGDLPGIELLRRDLESTCPWSYVIKVLDGHRDAFRDFLRQQDIGTLIQFIPNHLQPTFAAYRKSLPKTEELFRQIVSIPFFAEITDEQVEAVIAAVKSFAMRATDASTLVSVLPKVPVCNPA